MDCTACQPRQEQGWSRNLYHNDRFEFLTIRQRFLSAYGPSAQHFRLRRHRWSAPTDRQALRTRFQLWQELTLPAMAACEQNEEPPAHLATNECLNTNKVPMPYGRVEWRLP
jgi:hypothetical protein